MRWLRHLVGIANEERCTTNDDRASARFVDHISGAFRTAAFDNRYGSAGGDHGPSTVNGSFKDHPDDDHTGTDDCDGAARANTHCDTARAYDDTGTTNVTGK